jgi:hypothetical protein
MLETRFPHRPGLRPLGTQLHEPRYSIFVEGYRNTRGMSEKAPVDTFQLGLRKAPHFRNGWNTSADSSCRVAISSHLYREGVDGNWLPNFYVQFDGEAPLL